MTRLDHILGGAGTVTGSKLGFLGGLVTLTVNALITGAGDLGGTMRSGIR